GLRMIKPAGGRITCGYGWRRHPFTKRRSFHTGIDFGAPRGSSIKAAQDGKVVFAGVKNHYGNAVIIRHKKGLFLF
ncbi:MAG: M23 family metallopeptidase, partial [Candidatus Thorarchaeota archaeon]